REARIENAEFEQRQVGAKAGRHHRHDLGHEDLGGDREREEEEDEPRQHIPREGQRLLLAVALELLRVHRHERGGESAFGDEPAEEIGKPPGDDERLHDARGAEFARSQDVAQIAEDAREQRVDADDGSGAEEGHRPKLTGTGKGGEKQKVRIGPFRRARRYSTFSGKASFLAPRRRFNSWRSSPTSATLSARQSAP